MLETIAAVADTLDATIDDLFTGSSSSDTCNASTPHDELLAIVSRLDVAGVQGFLTAIHQFAEIIGPPARTAGPPLR